MSKVKITVEYDEEDEHEHGLSGVHIERETVMDRRVLDYAVMSMVRLLESADANYRRLAGGLPAGKLN